MHNSSFSYWQKAAERKNISMPLSHVDSIAFTSAGIISILKPNLLKYIKYHFHSLFTIGSLGQLHLFTSIFWDYFIASFCWVLLGFFCFFFFEVGFLPKEETSVKTLCTNVRHQLHTNLLIQLELCFRTSVTVSPDPSVKQPFCHHPANPVLVLSL